MSESRKKADGVVRASPTADPPSDSHQTDDLLDETLIYSTESEGAPESIPARFGRYEVRSIRGRGGFGVVYLGFDAELNREVAIKVPRFAPSAHGLDEFLQEARRLARLRHPGIVTVYDVGLQDNQCYIISELLRGETLTQWLKNERPTWQQACGIAANIADALAHAHANQTVHRDVKPGNVMLVENCRPVLLDFGLALTELEASGRDDFILGTPNYMSPEQARGEAHRIDGRTDIYSLGVVLYQMLTGRLPFRAEQTHELLRKILEDDPQPPRQIAPEVPAGLEQICLKALAKSIGKRYTTAADLAADLRNVLNEGASGSHSGTALAAAAGLRADSAALSRSSQRRAREAERRQVTMVQCNCQPVGGDEDAEVDPDLQHELFAEFADTCERAADRYHGTVIPMVAGGVSICFGYPISFEDAARRAVRTGLDILSELTALNERHGQRVEAWIGVHSGLAVVEDRGLGAVGESLTIVGEAPTLASKLEGVAEPGELIVSEATRRLIKGYFATESLGQQRFRGIAKPVEVHRVLRAIRASNRVEMAEASELTPLIGRNTELSILKDRWEQAVEGMGQVVLLIGDAGLGKSRLVREIRQFVVNESDDDPAVVEWRCSPYHQNSSLYPPTEFFERLLELNPSDSAANKLDALEAYLKKFELNRPETARLFAALLSLPGDERYGPLTLAPQRRKQLTLEALMEWLRQLSSQQPVLFILEDLHWVDSSTLELLSTLIDEGFQDRILTLLTFRPEFETPWSSKAHQTQVALNRLTKKQIGQMMARQTGLPELPPEVVEQVIERTDGVPLFVEEFTKMLQESGALRAVDGAAELAGPLAAHEIPATLQDLLMARLDRLASDLNVVQMAASIGREFSFELLEAAADLDRVALQHELDKLVAAEMLFQKGRPPDCRYVFKHALIQDAACLSLVKKRRRQVHRAIADALLARFPDVVEGQPELVAQHLTEAGDDERAVAYWLKAGQRSQSVCANHEALSHLERGLALVRAQPASPQRDGRELEFQLTLTAVLIQTHGYASEEVSRVQCRSRELCEAIGHDAPLFHVLQVIWALNLIRQELAECGKLADQLVELAESKHGGDDGFVTEAHWTQTCTLFYRGEFEASQRHYEQGIAHYDREKSEFHAALAGHNSGISLHSYSFDNLWIRGFPEQAFRRVEECAELDRELKHPHSTAVFLYHKSFLEELCRLPDAARATAEAEIELCTEQGYPFFLGLGEACAGAAALLEGDYEQAVAMLRQGIAHVEATGALVTLSHYYGDLAEALWRGGERSAAESELNRAFELGRRTGGLFVQSELHRLEGLMCAAEDPSRAETCLRRAIDVARRQHAKGWELRATMSLCRLQQDRKVATARDDLAALLDWFTEGLATPDLVEARKLCAALHE